MNNQSKIWTGPRLGNINKDKEMSFLGHFKMPIFIGLTGPTKSGKTIVARRMITEYNFNYFNLSKFIKEHAQNLGFENLGWKSYSKIAEQIRLEYGCSILAKWAIERTRPIITSGVRIVFDGVLHPAEINHFSQLGNFFLIGMEVSEKVRFTQAKRWFPNEFRTLADLRERDIYEQVYNNSYNPIAPNIKECLSRTNYNIKVTKEFNNDVIYMNADSIIREVIKKSNLY